MARTIIGVNDAKAIKKWSGMLAYDTSHKSYFNQRFMARGSEAEVPIQILTDLESDAGEQISYDLLAELKMAPVESLINGMSFRTNLTRCTQLPSVCSNSCKLVS